MKTTRLRNGRTVAVIGSIAVIGGGASAYAATRHADVNGSGFNPGSAPAGRRGATPLARLTAGEFAALAKARAAIAAAASSIATPILDRALAAGTISAAQRTAFLDGLRVTPGAGSGPDGTWAGATGSSGATGPSGAAGATERPSSAAESVFESARSAIQAQAGAIATPVLDAAVSAGTITSAEETRLLALLESGPTGAHGGPGAPPGGRPNGAPPGYGPNGSAPPAGGGPQS